MIIDKQEQVTDAVLQAMAGADNPRLVEVMASLVRHLHDFAREVKLTEREFEYGLEFLNRIGQTTNDRHNEAVLFSDAIGFSTLVCLLNNGQDGATETAAALLGPFWRANSPLMTHGDSIVRSPTPGAPLFVKAQIRDARKQPIAGVKVDVWQSSPAGMYENQDDTQADMNLRGSFVTDSEGRFSFRSVKPGGYPVPVHGPTGDMLRAQHRHQFRPAHLHFLAHRKDYKTLITQIFLDDDPYLDSDVVFGVTRALIGGFKAGVGPAPAPDVTGEWMSLDYVFTMEEGESVLPHPPIK